MGESRSVYIHYKLYDVQSIQVLFLIRSLACCPLYIYEVCGEAGSS